MTDFSTLPLSPALQPGLDALGYTTLTPIQAQSLPAILDRRDVIAQAPTGSGKTAAFGLGLLQAIDPSLIRVQALVLCPTRELADQVAKQIRKLATGIPNLKLLLLVGGVPLGRSWPRWKAMIRTWWSAPPAACRSWPASAP